ncbi:MAG: GNAT family N-acetyltransferase [Actinomycetota bacterium]|nr:GNAT family N-acetyltransferase [Actinomycetota bacterium]
MISLRPLRADEYGAWDVAHRAEYLRGLVEHVGMPSARAEAKVSRDIEHVLPHGLATPDTWIWAVEEDDRHVGTLFAGLREGGAWLYDITIAADERGKGYGRAAMTALEDEVRGLGYDLIGLNVWGGNEVARGLYRSLGWAEESVHMRKAL